MPKLADRIEAPLSRLARFGPRSTGEGFWSGLGVGAALGFVYAPCAGPVLAAVISVGAASGSSLAVALGYALGTAVVLLVFCLGGRRLLSRVPPLVLQRALGIVMVLTALAIVTQADLRFQTALAEHAPGFLVNPTGSLERSKPVEERLAQAAREVALRRHRERQHRLEAEGARRGAGLRRRRPLVQQPAADAEGPARPRRADRLLDLHLHQLPAHPPPRPRLGRALPQGRADDRRRPHAGVRLRARRRQRAGRDHPQQAPLPGRPGQRLRDLERLGQPVLAGQVPDRRQGPRPLRPLRRGRVRQDRGGDPHAARGGGRGEARRAGARRARGRGRGADAGDLPRRAARAGLAAVAPARAPTSTRPRRRSSTSSRSAGRGRSATSPPRR